MSKIALLLTGQLRSFGIGFEYINKNLLSCNEVDVYFHTWSTNWDPKVVSLYKPMNYLVEDAAAFTTNQQYKIVSVNHTAISTIKMYRSNMMADMLRRSSDISYDWIVRTRFDFALNTKLDFSAMTNGKMYYCNTRANTEKSIVHDQFVVTQPLGMDVYSTVYKNIDQYHDEGCVVNGENLLEWHLRKNGLLAGVVDYLDLNPPFLHGRFNCGRHSLIRDDMERWI